MGRQSAFPPRPRLAIRCAWRPRVERRCHDTPAGGCRTMARRFLGGLALALAAAISAAAAEDPAPAREAGVALARGQLEQAIALYSKALQDKTLPNERRAVLLSDRGVVHARLQNPKEAIEDFNRAIQLYPEYAAIYN